MKGVLLDKIIQAVVDIIDPRDKVLTTPPKRTFPVNLNTDLMQTIQPCDLVLYRFTGASDFVGGITAHCTMSPYSHAELHMFDGYNIEAGVGGVGYSDLYYKAVIQTNHVDIFRLNRPLTREERLAIQSKAYQSIAKPYSYQGILFFPFLSNKAAVQYAGNKAFICSQLLNWCYENANIEFVVGKALEAPADLGRSTILDYMGTFINGKKQDGNYRNQFMSDEIFGFATKIADGLIDKFSVKDEFYKGLYLNNKMEKGSDE
jgi:hypothetical protein